MLPNYDLIEPDKALYSEEFYLLLAWGRAKLFYSERTDIIKIIKESWDLIKNESNIEDSIETSLAQYSQDLENSLTTLNNIKCIENLEDMQLCLTILDIGIFFSVAFDDVSDRFSEKINNIANDIRDRITIDTIPSTLRLIPLNGLRQEIKDSLPEDTICYFPWYDEWTELPIDTFDTIAVNWKDFSMAGTKTANDLSVNLEYLKYFIYELTIDKELFRYIKRQAKFHIAMKYAVKNSISIRLFLICKKQAANYPITNQIQNKGLLGSAYNVICTVYRSLTDELDRLERLFLSAFCGPYLEDKQRMELFSDIEKQLPEINPASIKSGSPLESLYNWWQQKISDTKMAENIFTYWLKMLNNAKVKEHVPSFWHAVRNVQLAKISKKRFALPDWITDLIPDRITDLFILKRVDKEVLAIKAYGGSSEDKNTIKLSLEKNYIELPIEYDEYDDFEIPGKDGDNSDLVELRKLMYNSDYYWVGWVKIKGNEIQSINQKVKQRNPQTPTTIKFLSKEEYEYVLIAISDKEKVLENLLNNWNIPEEQKSEIIWLIYT